MAVRVNGQLHGLRDWTDNTLSGSTAPIVETRGYSSADDAVKTIAQASSVTFLWAEASRSNAGTITSITPTNNTKSRVLLFTISGTAAQLSAFQENTGTIGTPVWTTRMEFRIGADSSIAIAIPEQAIGPTGNGTGTTARLEVLSGTLTAYGTLHFYLVAA